MASAYTRAVGVDGQSLLRPLIPNKSRRPVAIPSTTSTAHHLLSSYPATSPSKKASTKKFAHSPFSPYLCTQEIHSRWHSYPSPSPPSCLNPKVSSQGGRTTGGWMIPPSDRLSLETLISLTGKNKNMRNNRTKDSIKSKLVDWFKMPADLLEDPRIEQLIDNEGMKGFGLYIAIICRIYGKRNKSITLKQVLAIKEKGCTKRTLEKVIHDYELFDIDVYDHVTSRIDYLYFYDLQSTKLATSSEDEEARKEESDNNQIGIRLKSDCIPTPACVPIKKEKENKKNDYHHSKKSDDGDDAMSQKREEKSQPSVYRSEQLPPVLMDPIQYLRSLPLHTAWAEALLQSLGLSNPILRQLVMGQWEETKTFLALHMASQDKAALLLSEHDVKRYFTNCLNNPTTARKLQEHLAAQRAKEQEMQQQEMRRLMES